MEPARGEKAGRRERLAKKGDTKKERGRLPASLILGSTPARGPATPSRASGAFIEFPDRSHRGTLIERDHRNPRVPASGSLFRRTRGGSAAA